MGIPQSPIDPGGTDQWRIPDQRRRHAADRLAATAGSSSQRQPGRRWELESDAERCAWQWCEPSRSASWKWQRWAFSGVFFFSIPRIGMSFSPMFFVGNFSEVVQPHSNQCWPNCSLISPCVSVCIGSIRNRYLLYLVTPSIFWASQPVAILGKIKLHKMYTYLLRVYIMYIVYYVYISASFPPMTPLDFACAAQFQASSEPQLLAQLAEKSATSISSTLTRGRRRLSALEAAGAWKSFPCTVKKHRMRRHGGF